MRKAIRIVSALMLAYTIIGAVFNVPSAILMLMDVSSYVADMQASFQFLSVEEAELFVRVYATAALVSNLISLAGMGFLVYFIRNAFNEKFKGKKAMLFAIPAFIFSYIPVAILLLIFGGMTLHEPDVVVVDVPPEDPPLE